ncbi:MAG: glycogen-binding domain-containing protein [Flavobacteriales bacterium]
MAQESHLKVKNKVMELSIEKSWSQRQADSISDIYELPKFNIDSVAEIGFSAPLMKDGWSLKKIGRKDVVLQKSLSWDKLDWNDMNLIFPKMFGQSENQNLWNPNVFGYNDFKEQRVFENADGTTTFRFPNGPNVHSVLLSGTFNEWSTTDGVMVNKGEIWELTLQLRPGRHEYKFIVDGKWMRDAGNALKIDDNYGDNNSIYFKPNHTFSFKNNGFNKVIVSGSFNNWSHKEVEMQRNGDVWELPVYLPDDDYEYKFIVDGNWIEDPSNDCKVKNEFNEYNSCLTIGEKYRVVLKLEGFANAKRVICTGDFNGWSLSEVEMKLQYGVWTVDLNLRKGKWEYRYIIDGMWYTDSSASVAPSGVNGQWNNYFIVKPNFEFTLEGYTDAKEVIVTGSFNNWNEQSLKMNRTEVGWSLPFYLNPGKISYKFLVDGKWIEDPGNPQYEENEFGGKNSIRWIN